MADAGLPASMIPEVDTGFPIGIMLKQRAWGVA
jgi:hypothetical protein